MDEDYELLSHTEVEQLKKELNRYKNNPLIKNNSEDKLYYAIKELTKTINKLSNVFEDVKTQILQEQEQGNGPDSKLDTLIDQNKQIAKALVNFGDKFENLVENLQEIEEEIPEIQNPINNNNKNNNMNQYNPNINRNQLNNQQDQLNQNTNNQINPETNNQNQEIDFRTWNYGNEVKPGVSKSEDGKMYQPIFPQQQFQPDPYAQQQTNEDINQTQQFNQQYSNQETQNEQNTQNQPNNFQQQYTAQPNTNQMPLPGLKPITTPKKKKYLGFF